MVDLLTPAVLALAHALGCGLLLGVERERRKGEGPFRALAGVRTFALVALLGASLALTSQTPLVLVGALFTAGLCLVAYGRDGSGDPGVTTEVALVLAFVIGVLCVSDPVVATALAVVATILLAARDGLHRFVRQWLQPGEVRSGLQLVALVLLVAPLVPDRPLWRDMLNPSVIVRLLIVLLLIQSLAHLGRRLLQARHAAGLSALASGFVSSTATIATLGVEAREGLARPRVQAGAALLSCVATMVQLLVVAAAVQPAWLGPLWLPVTAGALVAAGWGGSLLRGRSRTRDTAHAAPADAHPPPLPAGGPVPDTPLFRLKDAAVVAGLLTLIQLGVQLLSHWLGDAGLITGALVAALADLHSATAAVLVSGEPMSAQGPVIALALMAAVTVHACSKSVVAFVSGGWRYGLPVALGVLAHSLTFVAVLYFTR